MTLGTLATYFLKVATFFAITVTQSSEMYSQVSSSAQAYGNLTKYDILFLRSCSSLEWTFDTLVSFKVKKNMFLRIMNEVVVVTVINLLVSF